MIRRYTLRDSSSSEFHSKTTPVESVEVVYD